MRSYKDCLIEYVEERGFSELSFSWFHYVKDTLNVSSQSFQVLESIPPVEDSSDISYYADIIPADCLVCHYQESNPRMRSNVYKILIRELVIAELKRFQLKNNDQQSNLKLSEDILRYSQSKEFSSYSKAFKRGLLESGFDKKNIKDYFLKLDAVESNYFKAIEKFHDIDNFNLNIPKYGVRSTTTIVRTLAIDFDSHCLYQGAENEWAEQVVIPNSPFISGDDSSLFFSINSKAKMSPVKVSGELHGIEKTEIQTGNWFDEKMLNQLLGNDNKCFDSHLKLLFQQQVKKLLQKRFSSFYSFQEFDLTIEVHNDFTDEEIGFLRSNSFGLFPFHLSTQHECYKWIDRNDEGDLRIRIKSKIPQQTFFCADIEMIMV
ncbi:MAG: hypothetical protein JKY48_11590 [Flavobacteriales bacterium]|nr:hypothetical protein [Flavobacteriales bacterium]